MKHLITFLLLFVCFVVSAQMEFPSKAKLKATRATYGGRIVWVTSNDVFEGAYKWTQEDLTPNDTTIITAEGVGEGYWKRVSTVTDEAIISVVESNKYAKDSDIPTLTSELTNDAGFIDNEVDGDTTNEIQTISRAGDDISLTGSITFSIADKADTSDVAQKADKTDIAFFTNSSIAAVRTDGIKNKPGDRYVIGEGAEYETRSDVLPEALEHELFAFRKYSPGVQGNYVTHSNDLTYFGNPDDFFNNRYLENEEATLMWDIQSSVRRGVPFPDFFDLQPGTTYSLSLLMKADTIYPEKDFITDFKSGANFNDIDVPVSLTTEYQRVDVTFTYTGGQTNSLNWKIPDGIDSLWIKDVNFAPGQPVENIYTTNGAHLPKDSIYVAKLHPGNIIYFNQLPDVGNDLKAKLIDDYIDASKLGYKVFVQSGTLFKEPLVISMGHWYSSFNYYGTSSSNNFDRQGGIIRFDLNDSTASCITFQNKEQPTTYVAGVRLSNMQILTESACKSALNVGPTIKCHIEDIAIRSPDVEAGYGYHEYGIIAQDPSGFNAPRALRFRMDNVSFFDAWNKAGILPNNGLTMNEIDALKCQKGFYITGNRVTVKGWSKTEDIFDTVWIYDRPSGIFTFEDFYFENNVYLDSSKGNSIYVPNAGEINLNRVTFNSQNGEASSFFIYTDTVDVINIRGGRAGGSTGKAFISTTAQTKKLVYTGGAEVEALIRNCYRAGYIDSATSVWINGSQITLNDVRMRNSHITHSIVENSYLNGDIKLSETTFKRCQTNFAKWSDSIPEQTSSNYTVHKDSIYHRGNKTAELIEFHQSSNGTGGIYTLELDTVMPTGSHGIISFKYKGFSQQQEQRICQIQFRNSQNERFESPNLYATPDWRTEYVDIDFRVNTSQVDFRIGDYVQDNAIAITDIQFIPGYTIKAFARTTTTKIDTCYELWDGKTPVNSVSAAGGISESDVNGKLDSTLNNASDIRINTTTPILTFEVGGLAVAKIGQVGDDGIIQLYDEPGGNENVRIRADGSSYIAGKLQIGDAGSPAGDAMFEVKGDAIFEDVTADNLYTQAEVDALLDALKNPTADTLTASRSVALTDDSHQLVTKDSTTTLTLGTGFPVGFKFSHRDLGAGTCTLSLSSTTLIDSKGDAVTGPISIYTCEMEHIGGEVYQIIGNYE